MKNQIKRCTKCFLAALVIFVFSFASVTGILASPQSSNSMDQESSTVIPSPDHTQKTAPRTSTPRSSDSKKYEDPFNGDSRSDGLADPFETWNRGMFWFNDAVFTGFIRPVSKQYRDLVGEDIRDHVSNIFSNLDEPRNFVNSFLQGEGEAAKDSLARFTLNSTIGIAGIFDPASDFEDPLHPPDGLGIGSFFEPATDGFERHERTFDQTMAKWGIEPGFYIVWPIYGSSSARGTVGKAGDSLLYPPYYFEGEDAEEVNIGLHALRKVNESSYHIGEYKELKKSSVDPYSALKNVYEQRLEQRRE